MDSNRARGENMAAFAFVPSLFAEFVSEFVVGFVFRVDMVWFIEEWWQEELKVG